MKSLSTFPAGPPLLKRGAPARVLLAVLVLVVACRSSEPRGGDSSNAGDGSDAVPGPAPTTLENVDWLLVDVGGLRVEGLLAEASGGREPFMRFDGNEGVLTGHTGCNAFHGGFLRAGGFVEVGPVGATRRACEPPLAKVETAFLKALGGARTFEIREGELRWMDADSRLLAVFRGRVDGDGSDREERNDR